MENLGRPLLYFSFGDCLKKFLKTFFFDHSRLCPWPQAFLFLASRGSVLGLGLGFFLCPWPSSLVSSTPPLLTTLRYCIVFRSVTKFVSARLANEVSYVTQHARQPGGSSEDQTIIRNATQRNNLAPNLLEVLTRV